MGRGTAAQLLNRYPGIDQVLGTLIRMVGNHVAIINERTRTLYSDGKTIALPYHIVAFPTKPVRGICAPDKSNVVSYRRSLYDAGDVVPGYWLRSDIVLIERSAVELANLVNIMGWERVVIPRPGCNNGELEWSTVKPVLERLWDDRYTIITL